jgi:hypothetical protein
MINVPIKRDVHAVTSLLWSRKNHPGNGFPNHVLSHRFLS